MFIRFKSYKGLSHVLARNKIDKMKWECLRGVKRATEFRHTLYASGHLKRAVLDLGCDSAVATDKEVVALRVAIGGRKMYVISSEVGSGRESARSAWPPC